MKKSRKRRLETSGWTVGSAKEFLGLSEEEAAFVELKLVLADHLKRRRGRRGLTQMGLAKMLESSQSRVEKMESGDRSVTLDLLVRSLLAVGATRREIARLIASPKRRTAA